MESIINEILFQISTKLSTIQGNNFTLKLYTTLTHIPKMSSTSYIKLGECETILRQSYSILQTELLILNKYEHQIEITVTSKVEFSVLNL